MTRPKRALTPLEEAQTLFQAGHYSEALDRALSLARSRGPTSLDGVVLAARVHLRNQDPAGVIALLEPAQKRVPQDPTIATLLGIAQFRLGSRVSGLRMLERAHSSAADGEQRSEAAYYRAWAAYVDRDLETAERWVATSLDEASGIIYARGLALSGWIAEARGDYAGAIRTHRLVLSALRNGSERDDELAARIVHALATFAAETPDSTLADFVRAQAGTVIWPESGLTQRFETLLHLAMARVNDGQIEDALDDLDATESLARQRPAYVAQARLESADVYRLMGEYVAARRSLRRAAEALRQVDWKDASIDDTMALLESACLAARLDPTKASEWIARYAAAPKNDVGWSGLKDDPRVQALELHARGLVDVAISDRSRGMKRLHQALEIWERLGYRRRAAYAAADLAAAGDAAAAARVQTLLTKSPKHPLAASAPTPARGTGELHSRAMPRPVLSPSEHRVLDALCAGMSVKQMAEAWGRSQFTIRNHLKRLFPKFDVTSSAALVAKALNIGAAERSGAPPAKGKATSTRRPRSEN